MTSIALVSASMDRIITLRDSIVNTLRAGAPSRGVNNGDVSDFPSRLRQLRKGAGLSQEALALLCGYAGQSRISNYENGSRIPPLSEITTLAAALKVAPADLVDFDEYERAHHANRPSQPARLDEATLADALAVINGAAELRGVTPVLSPRAIAIAYALLEDAAERVSPVNMVRLIKAFMAKEEGSDVPSA